MCFLHLRSLDDDGNPGGLHGLRHGHGDLLRESLLDLQPPRVDLHDPSQLAETQDLAAGQVPDGDLSVEGHQVMFAHREHLDILHHHHFVVVLVEDGVVQHL